MRQLGGLVHGPTGSATYLAWMISPVIALHAACEAGGTPREQLSAPAVTSQLTEYPIGIFARSSYFLYGAANNVLSVSQTLPSAGRNCLDIDQWRVLLCVRAAGSL